MKYFLSALIAVFTIAIGISITMTSCKKNEEISISQSVEKGKKELVPPVTPIVSDNDPDTREGEDDNGPIVMICVNDDESFPLENVPVKMLNSDYTDSLLSYTNSAGKCTFHLPAYGERHVRIKHPGYLSFDTTISVTESSSTSFAVLQRQ